MTATASAPTLSPLGNGVLGRSDRPRSYKWTVLINTTIGTLMATIDASIVLISLPAIFRGIGLNPLTASNSSYLLWMLMSYMVVTAVLVVTFGRIGDMFGRVRMYTIGFAVFTVGSLAASLTYFGGTHAALYLIAMRVVQGIGGAMVMGNSTAILTDAFPENERGMALGINSVAAIAGSFIGLVAGGLLAVVDWHLIFYVSVPIGLVATLWAYFKLEEVQKAQGGRVDVPGNVLFGVGLIAVLAGFTYALQPYGGSSMGWANPFVLALLLGGAAMLVAFVVVEMKVAEPMFDVRLFSNRVFAAGNVAGLLSSVGRGGLMFMLIIWLQGIWLPLHGFSFTQTPLWAGIYMLPLTGGFLVAGPTSGYLSDRFGARPFATGGMIGAATTFGLLMLLPVNFGYVWFALLLAANGLAIGLFAAPNAAGIMNAVPANRRGVASGMRLTFQNAGMTLSIGLFFTIMIAGLSGSLPHALTQGLTAQGLSHASAAKVAALPPVSVLFAAFLGYNPMRTLLGNKIGALTPAHRAVVTGHKFFSQLISGPFHNGLTVVFTFALVMCLISAAASWMRGKAGTRAEALRSVPLASGSGLARLPATLHGVHLGQALASVQSAVTAPARAVAGTLASTRLAMAKSTPIPLVPDTGAPLKVSGVSVVTISASFGSGGSEIAAEVASRLGLPFFDRAIPLQVADVLGVSQDNALSRDERVRGSMMRSLVNLIGAPVSFGVSGVETKPTSDEDTYRDAVEQILWNMADGGGGVVLGRAGAVVLASCPNALHVRLDGPAASRAERASRNEHVDLDTAWQQLRRTDQARTDYVRQLYGVDAADPELYHVIIDAIALDHDRCVDAIVALAGAPVATLHPPEQGRA